MLDQMQVRLLYPLSPVIETFGGLFATPDFRNVFEASLQASQEDAENDEVPHSEDEVIFFVAQELSAHTYQRGKQFCQMFGDPPLPYLHHIGFVVGYLNEMMLTGKGGSRC